MSLIARRRWYGTRGQSGDHLVAGVFVARSVGLLIALLVVVSTLASASARAESVCTDTWTGPVEGEWTTAEDWSTGKVPVSTDVACIGLGKTVNVPEGASRSGVVQGAGTLNIAGSLEVANALEVSSIKALTLKSGGVLTGAGTVDISGSFETTQLSRMTGSGSTVIKSGASASITPAGGEPSLLLERSLINEGTLTFSEGRLRAGKGALIKNTGTFIANSQIGEGMLQIASEGEGGGGATPQFVNTGTFEKTVGTERATVKIPFENQGTVSIQTGELLLTDGGSGTVTSEWRSSEGATIAFWGSSYTLTKGSLVGSVAISESAKLTASDVASESANVSVGFSSLYTVEGTSTVHSLVLKNFGELAGTGTLNITGLLETSKYTRMFGTGTTVVGSGASASLDAAGGGPSYLLERTLTNEGTMTLPSSPVRTGKGAKINNVGTFITNQEEFEGALQIASESEGGGNPKPIFVNYGIFEKTAGSGATWIRIPFENLGIVRALAGSFAFEFPVFRSEEEEWGEENPSAANPEQRECGEGVNCATGNLSETQKDFAIGGRGVGLDLTRTYNSQSAAKAIKGAFGYGWSSSFSDNLVIESASKKATLHQANGSTVQFTEGPGGAFTAPKWSQDTLSGSKEAGYSLTLENQTVYKFAGATGRLESVTDRNGNATTLTYNEAGQLTTITDPASRTIKLTYNGEGLVESAEDPLKHVVKYTYKEKQLASVTQPAEAGLRWQFAYDGEHQLKELTDGRGNKSTNEYTNHQVTKQTDRLKRETTFEYKTFFTKTKNVATGAETLEEFTSGGQANSITHGYGTSFATTETRAYDSADDLLSVIDGNGHTTKYGYDGHSNRTSMVDANKNETKWTYNTTHDVETETKPNGETTTYKRDVHGNPEVIERPAPGAKTQATKYKYMAHGEVESMEDPLKRVSKYEYDTKGDRTAEIDPLSNKRTWEYNEDSQETATVSPRGNVTGGKPAEFTTKTERDAQGRPLKITDPLSHTTKYTYDGVGNVETMTDGNSHTTKYTYDANNERTKTEEPIKAIIETEYDGAGQVIAQIDGNKHTTKYTRNVLEQVTEITDPLGHKTTKEYDLAGNLKTVTDQAKGITTYTHDPANRLIEVSYSSGKPTTITYEYNKNGDRTKMTDGTGTSKYTFDQLDRLTETENGHKEVAKYEYDLANEQTKITYPNSKSVTRAYDKDGRLEKVTDWSSNVTKFAYDQDSDLTSTTFPTATTNVDKYAFNHADQQTEAKMTKGAETLASLLYTRDNDGQVKKTTSKGLPGAEITENTYDENNRLTKYGATEYKYDAANNPTKEGSSTNTFNEGDELEKGTSATYAYDELGERTKTTPSAGPATTYGYDQAGNLTSAERPKEGETTEIKDTYAYDGNGLRTSQTISGTTTYLIWDFSETLPLLLSDGTNSYIYGPGGLPVEQINGETPTYLHHDQQGSTRLLTGSAGTVTGSTTFDAYGNKTGSTGTSTTPLGYDAQYTDSDTRLVYLRARFYDPATAQFLSIDPFAELTEAPYGYAAENPVNQSDPTGECVFDRNLNPTVHFSHGYAYFHVCGRNGRQISYKKVHVARGSSASAKRANAKLGKEVKEAQTDLAAACLEDPNAVICGGNGGSAPGSESHLP
jgi:RHS repeat-associated protein